MAVSAALKTLGFTVLSGVDLKRAEMEGLVSDFVAKARTADVALFYYAGHGFQADDVNYLAPVDAVIKSRADAVREAIPVTTLMASLTNGVRLLFLDACRKRVTADLKDGLARMPDEPGFYIAFATRDGAASYDGLGDNSFFARAVLDHIGTPGQDISTMMINVRNDVIAATGGRQTPTVWDVSTSQFSFKPGDREALSQEAQLWRMATQSRSATLIKAYLEAFPEGAHAEDLRKLALSSAADTTVAARDQDPAGVVTRQVATAAATDEGALWSIAQRSRQRVLLDYYLALYKDGQYTAQARELAATIPAQDKAEPPQMRCERLATHPRDATANVQGVTLGALRANAADAIAACRDAVQANPDFPHAQALLARALVAGGRTDEGMALYRQAAERGDFRAKVSLGLILEFGDGLPKDGARAVKLYEEAAAGGFPDGAVNLAVNLIEGRNTRPNVPRALDLLSRASADGSTIATYNLGALAERGVKTPLPAITYFERAAEQGETRAYIAAAILLDEGRGVAKDAPRSAQMLLRAVALGSAQAVEQVTVEAKHWSPATFYPGAEGLAVRAQVRRRSC